MRPQKRELLIERRSSQSSLGRCAQERMVAYRLSAYDGDGVILR